MAEQAWRIERGEGPLIAIAIHDGHEVRPNLRPLLALSDAARLTEEDPCTGGWTVVAGTRVVGTRSRFEVDLNRPREKAVYRHPADSWGLKVWNTELPQALVEESLQLYDNFYREVEALFNSMLEQHRHLVVYDLHTYNHRRRGPYAEYDDAGLNPEVNLGTGTLDRYRWAPIIDRFLAELGGYDFLGRQLDVRENVRFFGGQFAKWTHHRFPEQVCVLSIEFKKFFMDEWHGAVDAELNAAILASLQATTPGVVAELERL